MKKDFFQKLNSKTVDDYAEYTSQYLKEAGIEGKSAIRTRLCVEEVLLKWRDSFPESTEVVMELSDSGSKAGISLVLRGEALNPLESEASDEFGSYSNTMFMGLEHEPVYNYSRGCNKVFFAVPKKRMNMLLQILIAVIAAVVTSIILTKTVPADLRAIVSEDYLGPLCNTYLSAMGCCGVPLIFLSLALGSYGIGDVEVFGKIGRNYVLRALLNLLLISVISCLLVLPFFALNFSGIESLNVSAAELWALLLNFIPTNLITPFIECNAMQLIILGAVMGLAILLLDPHGQHLYRTLEDLDRVLLLIFSWLSKLLPFGIFLIIINQLVAGNYGALLMFYKPWVICLVLDLLLLIAAILQTHKALNVDLKVLANKLAPTFLIALATDSCTASIPENYSGCGLLGIDGQLFGFGIPIGTTVYKPSVAIRMIVITMFLAEEYGVSISTLWVIILVLISALLSISVPAIPGGVMPFYSLLFLQLGIPAEALALTLATDIFFDFISTATAQTATQLILIRQADKSKMLDLGKLKHE